MHLVPVLEVGGGRCGVRKLVVVAGALGVLHFPADRTQLAQLVGSDLEFTRVGLVLKRFQGLVEHPFG